LSSAHQRHLVEVSRIWIWIAHHGAIRERLRCDLDRQCGDRDLEPGPVEGRRKDEVRAKGAQIIEESLELLSAFRGPLLERVQPRNLPYRLFKASNILRSGLTWKTKVDASASPCLSTYVFSLRRVWALLQMSTPPNATSQGDSRTLAWRSVEVDMVN